MAGDEQFPRNISSRRGELRSSIYFSLGLVYPTIDRKNGKWGSITLASSTGIIESEAAGLMVNDVLDKIGSRTGWTYGPIKKTCADLKVGSGVNVRIFRCSLQPAACRRTA